MKNILFINLRNHKIERLEPIYVAKRLGLKVILLADKDPNLDQDLIDDLIITDTYDIKKATETVVEYSKVNKISGVITFSEKDVELVARIGTALNLKTLSEDAAKRARNKYLMRAAWQKIEGLSTKFSLVKSIEDLLSAVDEIGTPGIFKPAGASGSKSIFKINSKEEIEKIYQLMKDSTSPEKDKVYSYYPGEYIYEEYITGPEVSVEGLVQDQEIFIAGVTDKYVTTDYSLEYLEIFPSEKDTNTISEIKEKASLAVKALGLDNCSFHLECRVSENGVKIIEVGARPGGGYITSHLIKYATDFHFLELAIKVAMGNKIEWPYVSEAPRKRIGHFDFLATKKGVIKNISGIADVMEIDGVRLLIPEKEISDSVELPPKDFKSCYLATSILEGKSSDEIHNIIAKMKSKLKFTIE